MQKISYLINSIKYSIISSVITTFSGMVRSEYLLLIHVHSGKSLNLFLLNKRLNLTIIWSDLPTSIHKVCNLAAMDDYNRLQPYREKNYIELNMLLTFLKPRLHDTWNRDVFIWIVGCILLPI